MFATRLTRLNPGMRGALYYLVYWGTGGLYMPFVNVHFRHLGFSGSQISMLSVLFPIAALLVAPPLTSLADRRTWRVRMLTLSLVIVGFVLISLAFPTQFWPALLLMAALAASRCLVAPIGDSLVLRMAARHNVAYGKLRLWGSFSFALIAMIFGAVWEQIGFAPMFIIAGLLCLPPAFTASLLEEVPTPPRQASEPVSINWIWRDFGLMTILTASFLIGGALNMAVNFEGVYMDVLGGSEVYVGLIFAISAFSEMPAMFLGETLVRRLGSTQTLLLSYGLMFVGYLGYTFATAPWMLLVLAIFKGMGFGLYFTSTVRLLDARVSPAQAATIQGVMNATSGGLAPLIAGPISGLIFDGLGPHTLYLTATILIAIAAAVLLSGSWRSQRQQSS